MRSSKLAFNTAAALQQVFIAPIARPQCLIRSSKHKTASRFGNPTLLAPLYSQLQHRSYASNGRPPPTEKRLPINDEIKALMIHIVDKDGKLSPPTPTYGVLANLDRVNDRLITVVQPNPKEQKPGSPLIPICKIISKKAQYEALKARKKKTTSPSNVLKTFELNWAIEEGDLKHRLNRIREFLEKGNRVDVVLAPKRKGRKATVEEAEAVLAKIKALMAEVEGSKEWKPKEGKVLDQVTLYLEGMAKKIADADVK